MAKQADLDGEVTDIGVAEVFYREAEEQEGVVEPVSQPLDTTAEFQDIEDLLDYIRSRKLKYPVPIAASEMDEAPADHSKSIIMGEDAQIELHVKYLLSQFCAALKGKQKEKGKYAMLVYFGTGFLLAHVRAEKGLSIDEDENRVELVQRFLDADNILSAALFEESDGEVEFSHFTDTGSSSFREFLGVKQTKYHYRKKNVQVICYYGDNIECKFEFSNEELESHWLNTETVQIRNGNFSVRDNGYDRKYEIKEIRWGNEVFGSNQIEAFKSKFKQEMSGLDVSRQRYKELLNLSGDSSIDADRVIDHEGRVHLIKGDNKESRKKGDLPSDCHVIFADSHIEMDSDFAKRIIQDLMENRDVSIYHPSEKREAECLHLNNIMFLNVTSEIPSRKKEMLKKIHDHSQSASGEPVSRLLSAIVLDMVSRIHSNQEGRPAFRRGLERIIQLNTGGREFGPVGTKENDGDGLIEYKNAKDLDQGDPKEKIVERIETEKKKGMDEKIFFWGITEQTREIDGLRTQSWNDDRLSGIQQLVQEELDKRGIEYEGFELRPIEQDVEGKRWVITGILY